MASGSSPVTPRQDGGEPVRIAHTERAMGDAGASTGR